MSNTLIDLHYCYNLPSLSRIYLQIKSGSTISWISTDFIRDLFKENGQNVIFVKKKEQIFDGGKLKDHHIAQLFRPFNLFLTWNITKSENNRSINPIKQSKSTNKMQGYPQASCNISAC